MTAKPTGVILALSIELAGLILALSLEVLINVILLLLLKKLYASCRASKCHPCSINGRLIGVILAQPLKANNAEKTAWSNSNRFVVAGT